MTERILPAKVSPELLRSLSAREFTLVALTFGFEQTVKRLTMGGTDQDDISGWEFLMTRLRQLDVARAQ